MMRRSAMLRRGAPPRRTMSAKKSADILRDKSLYRSIAFTRQERARLGLQGLLPYAVATEAQMIDRAMQTLRSLPRDLDRYMALSSLQERNERLFYRTLVAHLEEILPWIYTPTVGEACLHFSHIAREPKGFFITPADKGRIARMLGNWPERDVRVVVVGNPCNTNCLIAMHSAPDVPRERFSAMTRLDQNRAQAQLAKKAGRHTSAVSGTLIWGNHSSTQVPDFQHARIDGAPAVEVIEDRSWLEGEFFTIVQQRGAAIIAARGLSSAASAANALVDHVRDLRQPTPSGEWRSVCVRSDGSYGVRDGLISSFPVRADGRGGWSIVQGLELEPFLAEKLRASAAELEQERSVVADLLR